MIHNWIEKLEIPKIDDRLNKMLYNKVQYFTQNQDFINKSDITILFAAEFEHHNLRNELYALSDNFDISIIELGKLKKAEKEFIIPFFKELLSTNKVIFIGPDKVYQECIDMVLDIKADPSKKLLISNTMDDTNEAHSIIGYQRHLSQLNGSNPSQIRHLSLGDFQKETIKAEPIIRNSEYIRMDFSAIQSSYSFYQNAKLTGLNITDACKVSKFIGHSQTTKVFHLNMDFDCLSGKWYETAALIIWYLLEGLDNCIHEDVKDKNNKTYMVECEFTEEPIIFIKGHKSGRWWFKNPNTNESKQYYPCEIQDYDLFCKGQVPEKFMDIMQ